MKVFLLFIVGAIGIALLLALPLPAPKPDISRSATKGEAKHEARVIFGGDMMFDRYIRQVFETVGGDYIFSCVDPVLLGADTVVANLEGPITTNASVSSLKNSEDLNMFRFTFPPQTAELILRHNIGIVSIGNNHIANFSGDGIVQTKQFLDEADVKYFGDPQSNEEERVLRTEINDVPFSFVNWSDWTSDKTDHTVAQVKKEHDAGRVVVVYAHWGEEYVPTLPRVRQLAHSFVDAGASLVVGSHPHIVQEVERYKEVSIYYSLGNFIFDQYFSDDVARGLLLSVTFSPEGVSSIREIPIELHTDGRTCGAEPFER